jgi:hypothetical protein
MRTLWTALLGCSLLYQAAALAPLSILAPVRNLALRGGGFDRKTFKLGSCLQVQRTVGMSCVRLCKSGIAIIQGSVSDVKAIGRSGGPWTLSHLNWSVRCPHNALLSLQDRKLRGTPHTMSPGT